MAQKNNLYLAGLKGVILHFDGKNTFTPINSGTDKEIQDMWMADGAIMCVVSNGIRVLHMKRKS